MSEKKEDTQLKRVEEVLDTISTYVETIPGIGEFDFFNLFPEFQSEIEEVNMLSLKMVQAIFEYYLPYNSTSLKEDPSIHDAKHFDVVENLFDTVFEKMDEAIDMSKGLLKDNEDTGAKQGTVDRGQAVNENVITYKSSLEKPQLAFTDKVDNTDAPFQPRLRIKHNSQMDWSVEDVSESGFYENPYLYELSNLKYPDWERAAPDSIQTPKDVRATPLVVVDTEEGVKALVAELQKETSFAVDLEHHNFRSYQGFTCLIQISTRESDYLVDVIRARDHIWLLNEVFTNPTIMKVLHGADHDIVWLQKDFGVYMVNMFDTGQASRVLGFESFSLAYLLKRFCNVIANKEYQLADWRIRPLTQNMKKYAREDTHYLLYICDELRTLLAKESGERDLIEEVLKRSEEVCRQAYQKPVVTIESGLELLEKKSILLNNTQRQVFLSIFYWRDLIARDLDESVQFILPFASLVKLAKSMPRATADFPRLLHPVPTYVRRHGKELIELIKQAGEYKGDYEGLKVIVENLRFVKEMEAPGADMTAEQENSISSSSLHMMMDGNEQDEGMENHDDEEEEEEEMMEEEDGDGEGCKKRRNAAGPNILTHLVREGTALLQHVYHPDFTHSSSSSPSTATLGEPQLPVLQTASLLRLNDVSEEMAALQREKEQQQATLRQEVETALDLDEVLRDLAFISGMMEEDEEEEDEEEDDGRESGANGNEMDKGSLQEEYVSLRQAYRQMDEERAKQQQQQQQQQPESTGVVSSMENEEVISLKRPEPSQSVDEMLGVREIDRESNEAMKQSLGWKNKKARQEEKKRRLEEEAARGVEKAKPKAIPKEKMSTMMKSIGASDYMMDESSIEKAKESLVKKEAMQKKKEHKKRYRKKKE